MTNHLIIVGYDEIVSNKYMSCIEKAYADGDINGYSIVDLEGQKKVILEKLKNQKLKPTRVICIPEPPKNIWSNDEDFVPVFEDIKSKEKSIIVYIATELKAHEGYLKYCILNNIRSLVEKPVFSPLTDGYFDPYKISNIWEELEYYVKKSGVAHSVMTLSRYHSVYNDLYINNIKKMIEKTASPITSLHLRHAGGVWNLMEEYITREDHPYKYGYGMLMHGGYHYLDLFTQIICLNKKLFPDEMFELVLSSFAAYPKDQNDRIPARYFNDYPSNHNNDREDIINMCGETDIVASYCLRFKNTKKVLTLGTISLEQTTPSVRNWIQFPEGIYNKNGRTSFVEVETQLGTLHSSNVTCFDIPVKNKQEIEKIHAFARIVNRTNGSLLKNEDYVRESTYDGVFHSESNKRLMINWLKSKENRSNFEDHKQVMQLVQALGESIRCPGTSVKFDF